MDTREGPKLYSLTSPNGLPQSNNEPTHIQTSSSSCNDLIFTDQPNLLVNFGIHISFHPIVIIKLFTLALILIFPNIYHINNQLKWEYQKADSQSLRKELGLLNWQLLFDQKDINVKIVPFIETILNVFRNYIHYKYITFVDKSPVWMNESIISK